MYSHLKRAQTNAIEYTPRQQEIMKGFPHLFSNNQNSSTNSTAYNPALGVKGLQDHLYQSATSGAGQQGTYIQAKDIVENDELVRSEVNANSMHTFPSADANALAEFYGYKDYFMPRARGQTQQPFINTTFNANVLNDARGGAKLTRWEGVDKMPEQDSTELDSDVLRFARRRPAAPAAIPESAPVKTSTANSVLEDLKKAKAYSDVKQYDAKHQLVYKLVKDHPEEFVVDSEQGDIVGLTHPLTGFKLHVPRKVIADINLEKTAAKRLNPIGPGFGQISTAVKKLPSQFGALKTQLTRASNRMSLDDANDKNNATDELFPATAEYQRKKLNPQATAQESKTAQFNTSNISKALGYSPGLWYDQEDNVSGANQMRLGNLISGVGLAGLGAASVPLLQYLFPERFKNKALAMNIAAITGGMALPWLVNFPHTFSELNLMGLQSNEEYTPEVSAKARAAAYEKNFGSSARKLSNDQTSEKQAYLPLTLPIPKMQLADVAAEQFQSGFIDYGQAAGLMRAAEQASSKPWITVRDLAHAAIGAGAGAIAGTAAAKGIGLFMNISPTEQKVMQGTGAALGTLINLGKFGI